MNRDNTVRFNNLILQIDRQTWRSSMEGCRVTIYQHADETITTYLMDALVCRRRR